MDMLVLQEIFFTPVSAVCYHFFQRFINGFPVAFPEPGAACYSYSFCMPDLYFVSFRFRFTSFIRLTFSIPSITNIRASPRSYFGPYLFSYQKCVVLCVKGVYGVQQTGKMIVYASTPDKCVSVCVRFNLCPIDVEFFQRNESFFLQAAHN